MEGVYSSTAAFGIVIRDGDEIILMTKKKKKLNKNDIGIGYT